MTLEKWIQTLGSQESPILGAQLLKKILGFQQGFSLQLNMETPNISVCVNYETTKG